MNCKQGDLAVIVRSQLGLEGVFVRCVRLHGSTTHEMNGEKLCQDLGPRWVIDRPIKGGGFTWWTIADSRLRPIRDNDGTDEILRLVGLPNQPETV